MSLRHRILVFMATMFATACSQGPAYNPSLGELVKEATARGALGPGDVFEVRVWREPDLSGTFQVSPGGTVDFPLLGTLKVADMDSSQVATTIRDGLARGYLRDPYVTVTIKEFVSKRVYVLGQVEKSGTFRFEEGMSIIQAITLAGGFTKSARPNKVVVTRTSEAGEGSTEVPVADISEGKVRNFYLKPGDIVYVPESIL